MKHKLLILFALVALSGCYQSSGEDSANMAVVEKYIQAVEAEDYDAMAALLDDNYLGLGPSINDSTGREAALASWKENTETLYDNIVYERSQIAPVTISSGPNQGKWVANWAQLKITYKGDRGSITIWANTNYKVVKGKITKSYTFYNEGDALRQLGYVFIDLKNL